MHYWRRNPDSEKLIAELNLLQDGYFDEPLWVRKKELEKINLIRAQLGLILVDKDLNPTQPVVQEQTAVSEPKQTKIVDPHQEARAIYQTYLEKEEILNKHREYCRQVVRETQPRQGRTPIRPLATMGTGGGPLLCDHCQEPIPLEGGSFQGVSARNAWDRGARGYSYISGGVSFMEQTNGTLRVYHDYGKKCSRAAEQLDQLARKEAPKTSWSYATQQKVLAFLQEILPHEDHRWLLNKIRMSLYDYDPGIGINRP